MAVIHCDFFSEVLSLSTSMIVIFPQATTTQIGLTGTVRVARHPILYLLHGMSDDHTIWLRRTSIERYVAPLGDRLHASCALQLLHREVTPFSCGGVKQSR